MESNYDSMMTASFLPYRMGYLTDWMVKKAEEELNETDEIRAHSLTELRKLIAKEKNLDVWTDNSYLLQFLRARKFDSDRAMELIRCLYTILKDNPDIFPKKLDTDKAISVFETNVGGAFPYRHSDGGVIAFINIANWNPDQIPIQLAISAVTAMLLSLVEDPATQVCGVHIVYDAQYKMNHLRAVSLRYIKFFSKLLRNMLPVRFNSVHIVNESPIFRYLFNMLKIFLSEKIRNRFHFHGSDMKQLHQYLPKEILPPEYGGDNINYSASEFCIKEFSPFVKKYSEMHRKGYF
ncbi:alpha-tocopherol transfer protein-like [Parasteatoda tepidariorum]|uniref:alpha-tocopherol transfer protein-like n=1 Tax=Parasteatoda tepidariorum TaxID=114398 RepID=UPI001C721D19|nr:alpha-tocopherol transfer protein-like [Parasteatoda tepidariorum]XP_020999899.2 alpha-tocopherol transfer protein-like [Parasteatoda tepidariorum]